MKKYGEFTTNFIFSRRKLMATAQIILDPTNQGSPCVHTAGLPIPDVVKTWKSNSNSRKP